LSSVLSLLTRVLTVIGPLGVLIVVAIAFTAGVLAWRPVRLAWRKPRFEDARRRFHWQREHLEAKFIQLAQTNAKRGAPRWTECEFDDDVAYVRNRYTGELSAFVAVGIAMDGSVGYVDQGGVDNSLDHDPARSGPFDAVGNLRAATAVFRFDRDHWETDGRAIFNLSPSETIRFYRHDLEMVGEEHAARR
jgi:hypothetical protein